MYSEYESYIKKHKKNELKTDFYRFISFQNKKKYCDQEFKENMYLLFGRLLT
jgi:hypothetical protein